MLIESENHYNVTDVIVYYDSNYASFTPRDNELESIDLLRTNLNQRGIGMTIADANELRVQMEGCMASGDHSKALLFLSGSLPDTIYDPSSSSDTIREWLTSGGVVYWYGAPIGKYIAVGQSLEKVNTSDVLFFNVEGVSRDDTNSSDHTSAVVCDDGEAEALGLFISSCKFGLRTASIPDSLCMGVIDEEGFTSVTLSKYHGGSGMIVSIGGNPGYDCVWNIAKLIASGYEYDSSIIHYEKFPVWRGTHTESIDLSSLPLVNKVYLTIGYTVIISSKTVSF
ncbi:MAG: hypothetical protein ACI4Q9_05325 [Candidatus Methanomethylophilaceae archaeon]